jgi:hypothetical protein
LAAGGTLEDRPRYNKSDCFDPFPFPLCGEAEKERIRKLSEELDAHRKRVQTQHGLTLTGLYNVLAKIRAGEKLTDKEKLIHDAGLVSVLKQLHDDLDAAVFAAYGWPATLTDAEILERLDVSPARKPMLAKVLWTLGFHWNQRRGVWQHPCGSFDPFGIHPADPRAKYRSYFPADVLPA